MATYEQVSGSGQSLGSQRIQDVNVKPGNLTGYDLHYGEKGAGVTTISQVALTGWVTFSDDGGNLAINLNEAATDGVTINIGDAGHPVDGPYYVVSVSGQVATTDYKYGTCFAGVSGTATMCSGVLDPLSSHSSNISSESFCTVPVGTSDGPHASTGTFVSRAYTDCWECFDGSLDPCDVTVTTVQWWDDDSIGKDGVVTTDGTKVFGDGHSVPGSNNPSGQNS